jgi:hypothetical protein
MADYKTLASTIAVALGTAIALIRSVAEFVGEQSPALKMKEHTTRATEMMDFVAKLQTQQSEESAAARRQMERGLEVTLRKLEVLAMGASEATRDPNSDLTFVQRLFIMFRPVGVREYIIHTLAYLGAAGGALLIVFQKELQSRLPHGFADLIILVCYVLVACRAWALAERRWRYGYEPAPDVLRDFFVVKKAVNHRMVAAQLSMWFCLFWLAEGLEDLIVEICQPSTGILGPAISVMMYLIGAALCRTWASAELRYAAAGQDRRSWRPVFAWNRQVRSAAWFARFTQLALLPLVFLPNKVGINELLDKAGFISVWMLSLMACSQWFVLLSCSAAPTACQARESMAQAATG